MTELGQAVGAIVGLISAGAFIQFLGANTGFSGTSGFGATLLVWGLVLGGVFVSGLIVVGVTR